MAKKTSKKNKSETEDGYINKLIIIDNKYCQFTTKTISIQNMVKKFLSYKVPGIEYTPAYRNGGWNGVNYLIDKKGYFYGGLYSKLESFLLENEIEFVKEDRRLPIINNTEYDLSKRLIELNLVPRDYQLDIVNAALSTQKGIVRAATGSGKTICTALITAKVNKPTIIYVIGLDLLKQFHDLYSSLFDEKIGFIGNGVCEIHRINIASIWTIGRSLKVDKKSLLVDDSDEDEVDLNPSQNERILKMLKVTKLHIFDESHVASTDTIKAIYKNIDPERIFGFSGTPFRDDNTDLLINGVLGEKIIDVSATSLITRKILAQPIIKFVSVPKIRLSNSVYTSIYKEYIVENDVRNDLIIQETKKLLEKKYTPLILFKQIKHGEILLEKFQNEGIKCAMLYGNDSLETRTEVKRQLVEKEIDIIVASVVFDIGLDLPILSALVLAGGGKSSVRALQRIGRVVRSFPGKTHSAIVDFYDQVKFLKQHSLKRCEVYESEPGFIIKKSKNMP